MSGETKNGVSGLQRWLTIIGSGLALLAPIAFGGYWLSQLQSSVEELKTNEITFTAQLEQVNRHLARDDGTIASLTNSSVHLGDQITEIETQFNCVNVLRENAKDYNDQTHALLAMGALKLPPGAAWPALRNHPTCTPPK